MRAAFLDALTVRMEHEENLFVLVADTGFHVFDAFRQRFASRFLNVGIAEASMIGVAAGLALSGKRVFTYGIAPFVTLRCLEQIRVSLCYPRLPVVVVGVGGGLTYGPAGMTHHAIEDVAVMAALPNMTVLCPGDPIETRHAVEALSTLDGPAYLRLGKSGEPFVHAQSLESFVIGRAVAVREGRDPCLLATGSMLPVASDVAAALAVHGVDAAVYSFPTVKPLDRDFLDEIAGRHHLLATLEEHSTVGGFGSMVAQHLAERGYAGGLRAFAIPDTYSSAAGSQAHLRRGFGLGADQIADDLLRHVRRLPPDGAGGSE